jgi:hypothetical protein
MNSRSQRRPLHFESLDDLVTELDRIESANRLGTLKANGDWTPGQILSHLAAWIDYGYTGYPMKRPPFFIRWVLRLMLRGILRNGMRTGVRIPGVKEGTYGQTDEELSVALATYRNSIARLRRGEPCLYDSPAFGPMSQQDRIRLNIRHAELHLSFLAY